MALTSTSSSPLGSPGVGVPPNASDWQRPVLSADGLGKRNDDPLGASDVGHPPRALVLADSAHQRVAGGRRLVDGCVQVMNLESDASQADLVGLGGPWGGEE